jgi:hypothetical protein
MGWVYCRKIGILDQIPIYVYADGSYQYLRQYATFDDLKIAEPDLDHQLLRNIIREERWLTPHNGCIYSILSPHENKLNLMKPLTGIEQYIIPKLEINYPAMCDATMRSVMNFIIAIDQKSGKAYSCASATEFARKLHYAGSTKPLNRKTISKYINSSKSYGGYKWIRSSSRMYDGKDTINISTL